MAEDWAQVAAEVDAAIKSVGQTDAGYPATLRREVTTGGNPYDPSAGETTITYTTLTVIETNIRERDRDGTLIGTKRRTLTVGTGAGVVPTKADQIIVGQALTFVDEATDATFAWEEIAEVLPLSPAGVDLLYEIDLVN